MELHRIDIPEELGGGWVGIKPKRSWKDSNAIAGAGSHIREGVSREEAQQAEREGRLHELVENDAHARNLVTITLAVKEHSGIVPDGLTVKQWLDSDEMDEDLGDFLLTAIGDYYASRKRTAEERKT